MRLLLFDIVAVSADIFGENVGMVFFASFVSYKIILNFTGISLFLVSRLRLGNLMKF